MNIKAMKREYLENAGTQCPYCKSQNIAVTECVEDGDTAGSIKQVVECHDCGREWTDYYMLSRIVLEEDEK